MSHTYGEKPTEFLVGQRVELHPGADLWMRGARFGSVVSIGRKYVTVKMDHPQLRIPIRFTPDVLRFLDH